MLYNKKLYLFFYFIYLISIPVANVAMETDQMETGLHDLRNFQIEKTDLEKAKYFIDKCINNYPYSNLRWEELAPLIKVVFVLSDLKFAKKEKNENEVEKPRLFSLIEQQASLEEIKNEIMQSSVSVNCEYEYATPLHRAVAMENAELVRYLHACGGQLDKACDFMQTTPLIKAAGMNNYPMVLLLLELGANVNYGESSHTVLNEALRQYDFYDEFLHNKKLALEALKIIDLLCKNGAKLNFADGKESTKIALSRLEKAQKAIEAVKQINSSEKKLFDINT